MSKSVFWPIINFWAFDRDYVNCEF